MTYSFNHPLRHLYNLLWKGEYQYTVFIFEEDQMHEAIDFVEELYPHPVAVEDIRFEKVRFKK